ncbi:hypothetical protein [Tahibacter harae]|uniref:Uncharacterized protein n=1 Tax=Tahibacter harae TaxID=2963937 RepID=A0ABT1QQS7_9GAMM|nr:hypothetical protein [Tahibacter harae]MCQ4164658.1 hypothetical protein [Tahibacter harae]
MPHYLAYRLHRIARCRIAPFGASSPPAAGAPPKAMAAGGGRTARIAVQLATTGDACAPQQQWAPREGFCTIVKTV